MEEIISSLKSDDYIKSQLESDRRIDELIKRVLNRTDEEKRMSGDDPEEITMLEDVNEIKLQDPDDQELKMESELENNENVNIDLLICLFLAIFLLDNNNSKIHCKIHVI